jgi:hypothetical protein
MTLTREIAASMKVSGSELQAKAAPALSISHSSNMISLKAISYTQAPNHTQAVIQVEKWSFHAGFNAASCLDTILMQSEPIQ